MGGQHLIANKENWSFFLKNNYKIIFMIRGPRDRVVSYAYKIKKFHPKLGRSISDLMLDTIKYYGKTTYNYFIHIPFYKNMGNMYEYYDLYLPWLSYPDLLVVHFENLVGPKAEGSYEKQINEIEKIANFLEITLSEEQISSIADNLFGDSFSFRDPKIGRWKEFFTEEHKRAFKATKMNQLLVNFDYETNSLW